MLAFVDNVNGNNSTAVFGRMDKPFATLNAAYAAGVASGQPFGCIFMPSNTDYLLNLTGHLSGNCRSFAAFGSAATRTTNGELVRVEIQASRPTAQDANALNSFDGELDISNIFLVVIASGANVNVTDADNSYSAGYGGNWCIHGIGMVEVYVYGGSREGDSEGESSVTGGNGGSIILSGPLVGAQIGIYGGTGDVPGNPGTFAADGCDLRLVSIPAGDVTLGRCAYNSAMIIVTNNKGGNADYA